MWIQSNSAEIEFNTHIEKCSTPFQFKNCSNQLIFNSVRSHLHSEYTTVRLSSALIELEFELFVEPRWTDVKLHLIHLYSIFIWTLQNVEFGFQFFWKGANPWDDA